MELTKNFREVTFDQKLVDRTALVENPQEETIDELCKCGEYHARIET